MQILVLLCESAKVCPWEWHRTLLCILSGWLSSHSSSRHGSCRVSEQTRAHVCFGTSFWQRRKLHKLAPFWKHWRRGQLCAEELFSLENWGLPPVLHMSGEFQLEHLCKMPSGRHSSHRVESLLFLHISLTLSALYQNSYLGCLRMDI